MDWYGEFRPYVPVAQRRAQAAREVAKRTKKGQAVSPVNIEGKAIASTFWGKAWCTNLESYSDFANRLPRGGFPSAVLCTTSRMCIEIALGVTLRAEASCLTILIPTFVRAQRS